MILNAKKNQLLGCCANFIVKSTVTSIVCCLNCDMYTLVNRFLLNGFNLDTSNNYFEIFDHKMNTRNNHSIRLPVVKLELACRGFFFASGILYNSLPLELCQVDDTLLFKRRLKKHSNRFSA